MLDSLPGLATYHRLERPASSPCSFAIAVTRGGGAGGAAGLGLVPSPLASLSAATMKGILACQRTAQGVGKATIGVIIRRIVGLSALSPWLPLPPCPWALQWFRARRATAPKS